MRTVGIDLAADPKKTGVATVLWRNGACTVQSVAVGQHDDHALCEAIGEADKTGIDCPLGWPSPFIDYLIAHRAGGHDLTVPDGRISLTHRTTDRYVTRVTGVRPLSVSADRIGSAAMRCAAILSMLTKGGAKVDRTGLTGPVVEVYPAAALRIWGLLHKGYKGNKPPERVQRAALVESIVATKPWLDFGPFADVAAANDDALDAVLCAVIAGLAVQGGCELIPDGARLAAETEGWIALPVSSR